MYLVVECGRYRLPIPNGRQLIEWEGVSTISGTQIHGHIRELIKNSIRSSLGWPSFQRKGFRFGLKSRSQLRWEQSGWTKVQSIPIALMVRSEIIGPRIERKQTNDRQFADIEMEGRLPPDTACERGLLRFQAHILAATVIVGFADACRNSFFFQSNMRPSAHWCVFEGSGCMSGRVRVHRFAW
jgi:hypothetical protein